ncbi:Os02g0454300 [Oryza sativa Japonica Group]|uniref:Os02g0454300 protein n=2 Tax=Oryza sativa subsp. japonica TaxID=39947 RepID=B9EZT5_ORYSJ|nr:hypothetical protein OsJ_06605 [Oryza sativa Japonica Group]BAD19504.1 unknown protein [Oryza sativa Japonica Group]BAD19915.1 unknown protein [Oryza sativa Japonica Group]BAF08685.1 Os02g0454300 [Oryza sativa Japonica Group]BAG98268.1 unnamed protein product [Oryza sativa Japonica Group]|eukprot:NP_001046771.1 Os02g0454300 [Oryza sativa Japonica Group]
MGSGRRRRSAILCRRRSTSKVAIAVHPSPTYRRPSTSGHRRSRCFRHPSRPSPATRRTSSDAQEPGALFSFWVRRQNPRRSPPTSTSSPPAGEALLLLLFPPLPSL